MSTAANKTKEQNVLYQWYEETKPKDDQFITDVDQWETSQTRHSTFKTGALDKPELVDNYDYVFDESQMIKFVMDCTMSGKGHLSAKDKLLQQQIEEVETHGESFFDRYLTITYIPSSKLSHKAKSIKDTHG
jgi:hypothetical protein